MFSLDRMILEDGSASQKKIIEYVAFAEEIHVILFSFRGESSHLIHPRVFIYPTSHYFRFNPWYFFRAFAMARTIIRVRNFSPEKDVMTAQDVFPTGVAAYAVRKLFGIPLQLQVHIDFFKARFRTESLMNRLYFLCARFLLPRADAVRVVSAEIREYLVDVMAIKPKKIALLPVFCDIRFIVDAAPRFDLHKKYPDHSFLIVAIARFVPQKNLELCIRSMDLIFASHRNIGLVLVGSGPEEHRLRSLSAAGSAHKNIFFESWTDTAVSYNKGADVFLFPSWYEGWGLAVIEAMACGVPVVATPVGCVPLLIENGKSGYIIEHDDAAAVAQHIRFLYENCASRLAMGAFAREAVLTRLSYDKTAYFKEYAQALAIAFHGA